MSHLVDGKNTTKHIKYMCSMMSTSTASAAQTGSLCEMDLWIRFHSSNCGMCIKPARSTHTNNMAPSTADTLSPSGCLGSNWLT
eukprot:2235837-Amphidinium_carterae.1